MARPAHRMKEMFALYSAGYTEDEVMRMMNITDQRIWYQYKRRYSRFLSKNLAAKGESQDKDTAVQSTFVPEGYAPLNPLMYDKNIGTDQSKVIDELIRKKKLDKMRSYELKKLFKPIGDDRFTRRALEILASRCRDMNLPWNVSTELGWRLRRKISRRFGTKEAEMMASEVLDQYVKKRRGKNHV